MARAVEQIRAEKASYLSPGWVWPRALTSDFQRLLACFAAPVARLEEALDAIGQQIDPRQANELLADFERVLGPDPCGLDDPAAPTLQRRATAHRRWTARGGASAQYFIDLAALYGVTITITTCEPLCAGDECGSELVTSPEEFVWVVGLPLSWSWDFEAGGHEAGDPLGDVQLSPVECLIRRYAPAHTLPVFSYTG